MPWIFNARGSGPDEKKRAFSPIVFGYKSYLKQLLRREDITDDKRDSALREMRLREDTELTLYCILWLAITALIATVFAEWGLSASTSVTRPYASMTSHICLSVLWALGIFSTGAMIGFLFGIPRAAQTSGDSDDNTRKKGRFSLAPNTNLEQISDWLTKIIVGVSLVEARDMASRIHALVQLMSGDNCGISCEALALAIIITFSVIGFLMGYLATRMFLSPVFNLADGATAPPERQAPDVAKAKVGPNTGMSDPEIKPYVVAQAMKVVDSGYVPNLNDSFETRYVHAKSLLVAGDYKQAALEYALLVAERPSELTLRCERLWAIFCSGRHWDNEVAAIVKVLDDSRSEANATVASTVYLSLSFHYLYAGTKQAAQRVVDLVQEYEQKNYQPLAGMYINLACAHAQLYDDAVAKTVDNADTINPEEQAAADAIKKAIQLEPESLDRIKELMDAANEDNDLAVFAQSATVRKALGL
jgi:hypothetical protein